MKSMMAFVVLAALLSDAAADGALRSPTPARARQPTPRTLRTPPLHAGNAPTLLRLRGGMSSRTAWLTLFGATGFELMSTYYMHQARGFSVLMPSVLAVIFYGASFTGFNLSLRGLEISVAYAVWSAIVMAALAWIGMAFLGESVTAAKIAGIIAIIFGTILLSLSGVDA